jgi:hypothetical protein
MNRQEWNDKEEKVYKKFKESLNNIKIMPRAQLLVKEAPPVDSPGRKYYINFDFFLRGFDIPAGASKEELIMYKNFIDKLDESGQLKSGVGKRIKDRLNNAISNKDM